MADYTELPARIGRVIPYFFFDAIGRIVPGSLFVIAVVSAPQGFSLECLSKKVSGTAAPNLALGFLFLLFAGYLLGFLLGAVSYRIVDRPWAEAFPLRLRDVQERFGASLEERFEAQFKSSIPDNDEGIVASSWRCAYLLWNVNPYLGVLAGRWDAEALLSRNVVAASLLPLTWTLLTCQWAKALVFLATGLAGLLAYEFHRRKQVFGRFDLFMVLSASQRT